MLEFANGKTPTSHSFGLALQFETSQEQLVFKFFDCIPHPQAAGGRKGAHPLQTAIELFEEILGQLTDPKSLLRMKGAFGCIAPKTSLVFVRQEKTPWWPVMSPSPRATAPVSAAVTTPTPAMSSSDSWKDPGLIRFS